jgi:hypothetical protein
MDAWPGLADGSITVTFRRWKRRHVVPGNVYRTPAGMLQVDAVDVVDPDRISDADARRAGAPDAAELRVRLGGDPAVPVYRIAFHRLETSDPRTELAHDGRLSDADAAAIDARLDRLDRVSKFGPWTAQVLDLIARHPGRRAGDLAAMVGRERAPFKLDVRKLKNLGLTLSLDVGYRLSPRGEAYLARTRRAAPSGAHEPPGAGAG